MIKGDAFVIITDVMIAQSYSSAKKVHEGKIPRTQASTEVSTLTGMDSGSASAYITVFLDMIGGQAYKRTINGRATIHYLECILRDYGVKALSTALDAVDGHVVYYSTLGKGQLTGINAISKIYRNKCHTA